MAILKRTEVLDPHPAHVRTLPEPGKRRMREQIYTV